MFFCGDLSVPNMECGKKLKENMTDCGIFDGETVVINLEGVIKENNPADTFWKVYNDRSVLSLKETCKQLVFNLANNHMYDYPEDISHMKDLLDDAGILYFGLDENPLEIDGYAIFGHCWEIYTKTNTNRVTDDHVNDITYQQFYERVVAYINQNPNKKVICCFHWNFDMERFPFPAYKKLAHDLIDYGVEAVIGNHAHVVQEVEEYRGKIIAYGLGNYYMPDGYYFNGTLKYPENSHVTLTVNLPQMGGYSVKKFNTDTETALSFLSDVEPVRSGDNVNEEEYEVHFKAHRIKKRFTPIYNTYDDCVSNRLRTRFLIFKINSVRFIKMSKDRISQR